MTTNTASPHRTASATSDATVIEQLTLLATPTAPARFRLSNDTRQRGLRHVAEIRRMLSERSTQALAADHPRAA